MAAVQLYYFGSLLPAFRVLVIAPCVGAFKAKGLQQKTIKVARGDRCCLI